ncbi:MAG: histidine kinase [Paenibacillaceae bacterium]|jgi:two-component system sensor histidine kinase YesM|nr:histidine kinase [Paenibacillaceae bacterium]
MLFKRAASRFNRNVWPFFSLLAHHKKIWLGYLVFILLPALLFQKFYSDRSAAVMKQEVTNSILQAIRQVESNISYRLNNVKEMSDLLFMNPDFHQLVGRPAMEGGLPVQIDDQRQLYKMIIGLENRDEVRKVRLFVDGQKIYASDNNNFFDIGPVRYENWFMQTARNNGKIFWNNTVYQTYMDDPEGMYVISVARVIKDPRDFSQIAGVLVLDMPESILAGVLRTVEFPGMELYVTDGLGKVISHLDESRIATVRTAGNWPAISKSKEGIVTSRQEQGYIIHKTIPSTGWKIVAYLPEKAIMSGESKHSSAAASMVGVITVLLVLFLGVFVVFAIITESTIRRIRQIGAMIQREGLATFDEGQLQDSGAIFGLEKNVGRLINTVSSLMEETYEAKGKEREAQLKALQAQINPHFLYNTLDTINWMAIRRDADEISSTVGALAQYFRLSLNKGRDIVTVSDELELARAYLDIQASRFADMFTYEMVVEEAIRSLPIPKLSLQPIIENALLHGIQNTEEQRGTLLIEGGATADGYWLQVTDDGAGMEEGRAAVILEEPRPDSGGYGLYNVHERIRLFAGQGSGLAVHSRPGEGTRVEIRVELSGRSGQGRGSMNRSP